MWVDGSSRTQNKVTNIISRLANGISDLRVHAIGDIDDRSGFLEHTKCLDQRGWKPFGRAANIEILE
jgi:hypothetical protein